MDKLVLGFMADVLYLKGVINYDEFDAIQNVTYPHDLTVIVDRLIGGDFNAHKRGEGYISLSAK